jgi:ParB-like chromosome segregation protein Spo0J
MQKVKITQIKNNPNNPRIIKDVKFKQLVQSIKDLPEMLELRPIVVNADMVVLGGNMRLKACIEAGLKEVPIIIADNLDEAKQKQFIIKDNIGYGEWDWNVLANEWEVEELEHWGLELPIFADSKEPDDLSDTIKQTFRIEIICEDEQSQEKAYNKLIEEGYECRLLTL